MPDPIRVLDLFAGAGGITRGFHAASSRFRTVAAVEMDMAAAATFKLNFPETDVYAGPIEQWLADDVNTQADVVVGGPPCQGFSTLGKQDVEDERNSLWRQYANVIAKVQPKYFLVENVAAFTRSPQFAQFEAAIASDPGLAMYRIKSAILNAADYGAPQSRKRAVMIGMRSDMAEVAWPDKTHAGRHITVAEAFDKIPLETSDLPDRSVTFADRKFDGPFRGTELHVGRNYTELSLRRFAHIPPGGNRFSLPEELKAECWKKHSTGAGDVMGRLHLDRPAVTVRTEFFKPEKGRYLHPTADRAISHYEAAVLQGFPAEHGFVGSRTAIARQIGNAVPIPLARAIAASILRSFDAAS